MEQPNNEKGEVSWESLAKRFARYVLSCPEPAPKIQISPANFLFSSTEEAKTAVGEEFENYYEMLAYDGIVVLSVFVLSLLLMHILDWIIHGIASFWYNATCGSLESTTTSPATSRPSSPPKLPSGVIGAVRVPMNQPVDCVYSRRNKTDATQSYQSSSASSADLSSEVNVSDGIRSERLVVTAAAHTSPLKRRTSRTQLSTITGSSASSSANSASTANSGKTRLRTQRKAASSKSPNMTSESTQKSTNSTYEAMLGPEDDRMDGGRSPVGAKFTQEEMDAVLTTYFENYDESKKLDVYGFSKNKEDVSDEATPTSSLLHLSCHEDQELYPTASQFNIIPFVWDKLIPTKEENRLPAVTSTSNETFMGYDDDDARSSIGSWESDTEARLKESVAALYNSVNGNGVQYSTPAESMSEMEFSEVGMLIQANFGFSSSNEENGDMVVYAGVDSTGALMGGTGANFGLSSSNEENADMVVYAGVDSTGALMGDTGSLEIEESQRVKVIWIGAKKNQEISLTGSFFNWQNKIILERKGLGHHEVTIVLAAGKYEYKISVEEEKPKDN